MIFGQALYFAFLPLAAVVFRVAPPRARPWWLFATGLAVYAWYSPAFVALLLAEMTVVFAVGRRVGGARRFGAGWFALGLAVAIGVLVVFKYAGMLGATLRAVDGSLPSFPRLFLPLAISFFTFEFVHYLVELRRGTLPEHGFGEFLAFATFFPTMVAGPIKRFGDFQPQLTAARADAEDVGAGVRRILVGLVKKVVVADTATLFTAPLLTDAALRGAARLDIAVALLAFSVKILFDFSGYSDIAIGSARLFGLRVPENFAWPYLSTSIAAFWRSWHRTLTSWVTDYVYKPLGGNRGGLPRTMGNLVLAMLVSGLWHGAAWHFAVWGAYHGALLAGHRAWRSLAAEPLLAAVPALRQGPLALSVRVVIAPVAWAATFGAVTLGWALFVMPVGRFVTMLGRLL